MERVNRPRRPFGSVSAVHDAPLLDRAAKLRSANGLAIETAYAQEKAFWTQRSDLRRVTRHDVRPASNHVYQRRELCRLYKAHSHQRDPCLLSQCLIGMTDLLGKASRRGAGNLVDERARNHLSRPPRFFLRIFHHSSETKDGRYPSCFRCISKGAGDEVRFPAC